VCFRRNSLFVKIFMGQHTITGYNRKYAIWKLKRYQIEVIRDILASSTKGLGDDTEQENNNHLDMHKYLMPC